MPVNLRWGASMSDYHNILVATDLHHEDNVINKALHLAKQNNAKLTIINVVPNLPCYMAAGLSSISDIEDQLMNEAKTKLENIKKLVGDQAAFELLNGVPKLEIVRYAKEINADLIVIGSHGRGGVQRLLGSTANGTLHRAPCDVLVIRASK